MVRKFVTHSRRVTQLANKHGWLPGARYTNLRDVRSFPRIGFLDIDWKNYSFSAHLSAAKTVRPLLTVARDVENRASLPEILEQAEELSRFSENVVIVPKDPSMVDDLNEVIPQKFLLGYSVPTRYGETAISPNAFKRSVHLLGGRPDVQRALADLMPVLSFDCNRFTLDAAFGDYFDGRSFRPHPVGGYERCLEDSIRNINTLWEGYAPQVKTHRVDYVK